MIADTTIKRPALRYYGGKWNLAPWIISHFPPHSNYVEPCGGAASVLLQKPRSPLETYNDLDGNVVNFFRVLRDQPDELIRRIRLTPWARGEYEIFIEPTDDPVEKARRFFAGSYMSFNGSTLADDRLSGWRHSTSNESRSTTANDLQNTELDLVANRFIGVQIEKREYSFVIEHYDSDETLCYFDPPYVSETRAMPKRYLYEWTNKQHVEAATLLRSCAGYVVVSGYACPLYSELYEAHGWQRIDKEAQTNSGGKRIESLWLSPRTIEALAQPVQGLLI